MRTELQKLGDEFFRASGVAWLTAALNDWLIRDRDFERAKSLLSAWFNSQFIENPRVDQTRRSYTMSYSSDEGEFDVSLEWGKLHDTIVGGQLVGTVCVVASGKTWELAAIAALEMAPP